MATVHDLDNDAPSLSPFAMAALQEFLREQNWSGTGDDRTGEDRNGDDRTENDRNGEVKMVKEDWRLSQFWYERETAEVLVEEVRCLAAEYCGYPAPAGESNPDPARSVNVACVACPTLYAYLKKMENGISAKLLEFDERFEQYGDDFVFYDYNQPEELPLELKHSCNIIVADPPYLSKECLEKVAKTISFLANPKDSFLLLLTGAVQKERALELLNVRPCQFRPQHTNKLGNEFLVFTNYNPHERLGGWDPTQ